MRVAFIPATEEGKTILSMHKVMSSVPLPTLCAVWGLGHGSSGGPKAPNAES